MNVSLMRSERLQKSTETKEAASLVLFTLQCEQLNHDETYHREIARLTLHQRLNHLTLHFAKYTGNLAELLEAPDPDRLNRIIVDTFIISISCANVLNIRLYDQIHIQGGVRPEAGTRFNDLSKLLWPQSLDGSFAIQVLLGKVAQNTGRMAKACESLDHLEAMPYRETMKHAVTNLACDVMGAAASNQIDLPSAVRARLRQVKERFIFHES